MTLITPDLGIIFWQTITFLVVLMVLAKFAWTPILAILKERETSIEQALSQITEAKELMYQATSRKNDLLNEANLESERIVTEALKVQKEIIAQAHQEGLKLQEALLSRARLEISKEEARSLEVVKTHVSSLAVQMAEKLLIKELSQDSAQVKFLKRLEVADSRSCKNK